MNSYTDLQIIECNRLHSEEAKSNNDENFSLWTNNLQDIVHLEPGDKVSVHGAMISERGAGQSSSIEIKGQSLGFKQTFSYVNLSYTNASNDLPTGYEVIKAIPTTETIEVRDDTAYFKISYYLNANGHNYIHLPRRWWWNETKTKENFTSNDDRINFGMALNDPFAEDDYVLYDDFYQLAGIKDYGETATGRSGFLSKPRNDNTRFTLMVRDASYFSEASASGNLVGIEGLRDPENAIYYPYEELKKIEIPKGFNSPEFISEEVTRQLQKISNRKTRFTRNNQDKIDNAERPGHPIPMYQEFNAECYKAFNVASMFRDMANQSTGTRQKDSFGTYIAGDDVVGNASGFEYLKNYHLVACKRPELYTTGRLVNRIVGVGYTGILGSTLDERYDGTIRQGTIGMVLDITYNKENIGYWYDFIKAQEKYPEVFDIFTDTRTPYNGTDTIDNCRYCHINRFNNASMTIRTTHQLGHGGYDRPTWKNNASANFNSILLPFKYDSSQKDIYYDNPEEGRNQKTYGCFGKSSTGRIVIYPTENNGSGSNLFLKLSDGSPGLYIEENRRMGYDMHFSAPGNVWILPYSGVSQQPSSYDSRGALNTNYIMARNSETTLLTTYNYTASTSHLRGKLYMGADAPKINWNGTNFSISDFHTALNRGNDQSYEASWVTAVEDQDPQADDVVFKINPVEQYGDWTPARMPYVGKKGYSFNDGSGDQTYYSPVLNMNLEPWTIYDSLSGINIEDFALSEDQWSGTLWDLLGFSYKQFHSSTNNRLKRIDNDNKQDLSVITTNAKIPEGQTKFFSQNLYGVPLYNNMLQRTGILNDKDGNYKVAYYPNIISKTSSIEIVADRLPTRMIRGYYTIRSNLLTETPFIGGKVNNTTMPIIGMVDKINGDGDFYFGQESSLEFTITKPLRLASLTCSIHDPDGSYANTSEQNTILFKIQKNRNVSFNVIQEILQQNKGKLPPNL